MGVKLDSIDHTVAASYQKSSRQLYGIEEVQHQTGDRLNSRRQQQQHHHHLHQQQQYQQQQQLPIANADVAYTSLRGGGRLPASALTQEPASRNSCSRVAFEQHQMEPGDFGSQEPIAFHHQQQQQASALHACISASVSSRQQHQQQHDEYAMDARPSSTALEYQDLTQYSDAGARLHAHCEQQSSGTAKGFPHIVLSSRARPMHDDWALHQHQQHHNQHQHQLHQLPPGHFFDERDDKAKDEGGSSSSSYVTGHHNEGHAADMDAYSATSLLQQYRKHHGAMQTGESSSDVASFPAEYHSPGLLPAVAGYGVYPGLLKQRQYHGAAKPESPSERLPNIWDRKSSVLPSSSSAAMRLDRDSYLKPPPVDLDDLSDDERERMRVKRERNRVAAAKCRNRRRELLERLEKEAEVLEREQEVLRDSVKKLQAQKRKLGNLLDEHEASCPTAPGPKSTDNNPTSAPNQDQSPSKAATETTVA